MRYIGFDVSSVATGVAIIDREPDGELRLVHHNVISTSNKQYIGKRLTVFAESVQYLLEEFKPDHIIKELTIARMATQHIQLKFAGVLEMVVCNSGYEKIHEYAPNTIKKAVTGDGRASKERLAEVATEYIPLPLDEMVHDETDAVSIVLTHLKKTSTLIPHEEVLKAREADTAIEKALRIYGGETK